MQSPFKDDNDKGSRSKGASSFLSGVTEGTKSFVSQRANLYLWGGFVIISLIVYFFLSSGDFSFLLTYAALWRCFGLAVLNYKIWSSKSAKSVSAKTLQLYAVVFIVRLLSIMRHQGYLPFDKTGDWFYHFVEFLSLGTIALALFGIFGEFGCSTLKISPPGGVCVHVCVRVCACACVSSLAL